MPLALYESSPDGMLSTDSASTRGWSQDLSPGGIRFRTYHRLQSLHLTVICQGSASVFDDVDYNIDLKIAWERKLPNGLWEYGAFLKKSENSTTYALSPVEFDKLLAELRQENAVASDELPGSQYSDSTIVREQNLVLSLRNVANSFSAVALRQHLKRKRRHRLYSSMGLIAAGGATMVGLSMSIASMIPPGTWVYLGATGLLLIISSQLRD